MAGDQENFMTKHLQINDWVDCPHCDDVHRVYGGTLSDGTTTTAMLAYKCDGRVYIARECCVGHIKKHIDGNIE